MNPIFLGRFMKKFIVAFFLMSLSITTFANEAAIHCSPNLGEQTQEMLKELINKTIYFGYKDNSIHKMSFSTNIMDVTTATYSEMNGKIFYQDLELWECTKSGLTYLALHKDRVSPIGTYKYPVWILIGNRAGQYFALTDLRWGNFESPVIKIESRN
jgi:hypothetical protein